MPEHSDMKEAFDLFKDKDGRLPIGYIDKAVRATGILPSHYEIQQLIAETQAEGNTLDPEGTGTLTYAAFEQLLYGKWPEQDREDKIRNALKVFDPDLTGIISSNRLREIATAMGDNLKLTRTEVEEMLSILDTDSDGYINIEEIVTMFMQVAKHN